LAAAPNSHLSYSSSAPSYFLISRASRAKLAILAACWNRICCILASCRCRHNASFVSLYFCCIDAAEEILVATSFLTLDKVTGRKRRLAAHTRDADTGPLRNWVPSDRRDAELDGRVSSVACDADTGPLRGWVSSDRRDVEVDGCVSPVS